MGFESGKLSPPRCATIATASRLCDYGHSRARGNDIGEARAQRLPRHSKGPACRCYLPVLTGLAGFRRAGPERSTPPMRPEREGFEPSRRFRRLHAFQACLFNHSSTSPRGTKAADLHGRPLLLSDATVSIRAYLRTFRFVAPLGRGARSAPAGSGQTSRRNAASISRFTDSAR